MTLYRHFVYRWTYDTAKFEKVKVSDWNISFIRQFWRCLYSGEASVSQQNWTAGIPLKNRTAGALLSHHHYFVTWLFDKYLYLKYSYTQMCRLGDIFQKSCDSIMMTLLAPEEECHLGVSPMSCTYPTRLP